MLNSGLGWRAWFCHFLSEVTCITNAYDLPAPVNEVCRMMQRPGGRKGCPGDAEVSNPTQCNLQHHRRLKPFWLTVSSSSLILSVLPRKSCPLHHLHLLSETFLIWQPVPVVGAAQTFALCHQLRQRDSSVLKMEVCGACFVAGQNEGDLSRSSSGEESLGSVAATAEGSAAQCLYKEWGRRMWIEGAGCCLKGELEMPLWKGLHYRESGLTSGKICA